MNSRPRICKGIIYLVTQSQCNYFFFLDFFAEALFALFFAKIASAMESKVPGICGMILSLRPIV